MDSRVLTNGNFSKAAKLMLKYTCQFDDGIKAPNLISTVCVDGFLW